MRMTVLVGLAIAACGCAPTKFHQYTVDNEVDVTYFAYLENPESAARTVIRDADTLLLFPTLPDADGRVMSERMNRVLVADDLRVLPYATHGDVVSPPAINNTFGIDETTLSAMIRRLGEKTDVDLVLIADAPDRIPEASLASTDRYNFVQHMRLYDADTGAQLWSERDELLVKGIHQDVVRDSQLIASTAEGVAWRVREIRSGISPAF